MSNIIFRESKTTVYHNNAVFIFKCCDIHSNLFQTTQRNDL